MSIPSKPDWRRMPASAVSLDIEGPEFVWLRAKDARDYANECLEEADRAERVALEWGMRADTASIEADRWEAAANAFAAAWKPAPTEPAATEDPK